ncbi:hypothetical protein FRB97_009473 [Tulasnella sp. 331]|nr:hypothetical protein FRB97_009473 [Tulasnella sp. 331]
MVCPCDMLGILPPTGNSPFNVPHVPFIRIRIDLSNQVQDILSRTRSKIAVLDKLHAKHALPGFSDRSAEEREIESMTTDITRDFRKCQGLIQQITPHASPSSLSFPPSGPSRHQVLTAQNVQRGLAAKVQDLSGAFRKKQRVYMQKLQGHAIKNQDLLIASGAVSLKGSDGVKALEEDVEAASPFCSRSQLKTQQQSQEQLIAPDITQRTHEISEIARSIASLAEVFKDLSTLVIDQGTILDSVEYNIEQTTVHVQEAAKELQVPEEYKSTEVHLSPVAHHIRFDPGVDFQTPETLCASLIIASSGRDGPRGGGGFEYPVQT